MKKNIFGGKLAFINPAKFTGKNNGFPFLDILGYLKEYQ